jgi:hypothetical protein
VIKRIVAAMTGHPRQAHARPGHNVLPAGPRDVQAVAAFVSAIKPIRGHRPDRASQRAESSPAQKSMLISPPNTAASSIWSLPFGRNTYWKSGVT